MPAREQEYIGLRSSPMIAKTDRHSISKSGQRRSYLLRAALVPILLVIYPALALFGPLEGRAEFYPFFSWDLFKHSTEVKIDTVILVKEIDGRTLPEPTLIFDLPDYFGAAKRKDSRLAKMLDNIVLAERRGNVEMIGKLTEVIKATFMSDADNVKYDIAIIQYKPVERYRNGEIIKTVIVRSDEKKRR